ncbi:MAG: response regulator transcription factor [Spirochaetaceae bacterium]|jgi:DNA-binding response OmpR family regulator|nr:response regulator transcription factor [Spirochaetaceae bacterium]
MEYIYIVEDNPSIREAVAGYLKLADYKVREFGGINGLLEAVLEETPDLMILDIMLPDGDGLLFTKELREKSDIPIIFLSARESESDRITGFEVGGDDYMVKPFSARELVLRVSALLKRIKNKGSRMEASGWSLGKEELILDRDSHKALLNDVDLKLTVAEWKILEYLSSENGSVIAREQILERCLEYNFEGYDRTVDTHVKNLRAKMGSQWIETVRGYGYRFAGEPK